MADTGHGSETPEEAARSEAAVPSGALVVSGFLLSAETLQALEEIDLTAAPPGAPRRALMLERSGAVDARLQSHLREAGVEVETAPGPATRRSSITPSA